jgi:hypothetical protein
MKWADLTFPPINLWSAPHMPTKSMVGGAHYLLPIQPIEYIHANNLPFMEGNIVKYITRHRSKNGAEDIKKIIHYCELILEMEYKEKFDNCKT